MAGRLRADPGVNWGDPGAFGGSFLRIFGNFEILKFCNFEIDPSPNGPGMRL